MTPLSIFLLGFICGMFATPLMAWLAGLFITWLARDSHNPKPRSGKTPSILLILVVLFLSSCDNGNLKSMRYGYRVEEISVDSCQYLVAVGTESNVLVHKANCANPAHLSYRYSIEQVRFNGCEYMLVFTSTGHSMFHKANCSNPIHLTN